MHVIVGLGNPGKNYEHNRHNFGYRVIDHLAEKQGVREWRKVKNCEVAKVSQDLLLVKPLSFMNESGVAVKELVNFYKIDNTAEIWVMHDEAEIPFGTIRIKAGGTSAGHNGIKSLDEQIGESYWRIRLGIGRSENMDLADFVLQNFSDAEEQTIPSIIDQVTDYLIKSLSIGLTPTTFDTNAKKDN